MCEIPRESVLSVTISLIARTLDAERLSYLSGGVTCSVREGVR